MRDSLLLGFSRTGAGGNSAMTFLVGQAVLTGIFCGSFDITAHSLFLSLFDEKMMARAYIFSGLAGLILCLFYSKLNNSEQFNRLAVVNLIFISAVTFLLWILLIVNPVGWIIFTVFIMFGPLNILAMLAVHATSARLSQQDPVKYYSGAVDAGVPAGIILSAFSIPVLLSSGLKPEFFLLISTIAVVTATIIQISFGRRLSKSDDNHILTNDRKEGKSMKKTPERNRYLIMIAAFTILSVIAAFFVQYTFMAVTRIKYPSAEEMANFLGFFTGCMMIFTLIMEFLVFPWIIRYFRLRSTLLIPPLIIMALTIALIVTWFGNINYSGANEYAILFVLPAINRFCSKSFKESFEYQSTGIVSRLIDKNVRFGFESGLRGFANETGMIIAGLLLTGIGMAGFVRPVHFPMALIIIIVLWIISAIKLYAGYSDNVRRITGITGQAEVEKKDEQKYPEWNNRVQAQMKFAYDYPALVTGDLISLEKSHNQYYINNILDYADVKKDINLLPALKKIRSASGFARDIRSHAADIIKDLEYILSIGEHKNERLKAMMLLSGNNPPQVSEVIKLLKDKDNDLKIIALCLIRKFRIRELLPEVCECLADTFVKKQAENVLGSFKDEADKSLRQYYLFSSANPRIATTVVRLLGTSCSNENIVFLLSLLWSAPRIIRETALKSLAGCNCEISREEKEKLIRLITEIVGIITWNLSACKSIEKTGDRILNEAIDKENRRWLDYLFNLMSAIYGENPIKEIRENLESGIPQSLNHALEMIDILVDEPIKARLIILFDNISVHRKLNTLFGFYPGEIPDYDNLVMNIINRDYNLLGIWIRVCIIRNIVEIASDEMTESLIALLFSPELILRQEAARLLSRSGRKEFYRQVADRIPEEMRSHIENIINNNIHESELMYNKIIFISSLFNDIPKESLLYLAGELRVTDYISPEFLPDEGGYILWECKSGTSNCKAGIFYDNILKGLIVKEEGTFYYILPHYAIENYLDLYPEHSDYIFTYIDEIERRNQ